MSEESSVYLDIGERIRFAREHAGMTQADLGKFLGVSGPEVSRTEKGRRKVLRMLFILLEPDERPPLLPRPEYFT